MQPKTYAGGDLDYLAESAFQLAPAQIGLLTVGILLLVAAAVLVIVGAIRGSRARTATVR